MALKHPLEICLNSLGPLPSRIWTRNVGGVPSLTCKVLMFLSNVPIHPLISWLVVVLQWAVTTSVDFSLASLLQVIILLATGGANGGGYFASKYVVIAFHAGILFSHALINSMSITILAYLGTLAAVWNLFGKFICIATLSFYLFFQFSFPILNQPER